MLVAIGLQYVLPADAPVFPAEIHLLFHFIKQDRVEIIPLRRWRFRHEPLKRRLQTIEVKTFLGTEIVKQNAFGNTG